MKTECLYCGREWKVTNGGCAFCGAPANVARTERFYPFFYNGYIVYMIREAHRRGDLFAFYKGITCVGTVFLSNNEREGIDPQVDFMPEILKRLSSVIVDS